MKRAKHLRIHRPLSHGADTTTPDFSPLSVPSPQRRRFTSPQGPATTATTPSEQLLLSEPINLLDDFDREHESYHLPANRNSDPSSVKNESTSNNPSRPTLEELSNSLGHLCLYSNTSNIASTKCHSPAKVDSYLKLSVKKHRRNCVTVALRP
jgi:hypothetical protein